MKGLRKLLYGLVLLGITSFFAFYFVALRSNTSNQEVKYLYISSNSDYQNVLDSLSPILKSEFFFNIWSRLKKYPDLVKPGRYAIYPNTNNRNLVLKLRGGLQDPIQVRIASKNHHRDVLALMANQLECDSASLVQIFEQLLQRERSVDKEQVSCYLIPNSYEFYWNGDCESIAERLLSFYHQFWTSERKGKAKKLGLSPCEVSTLAAIVQKETSRMDEMPKVAGVYLNRLKTGMRLQADPTLIFAMDKKVSRVLDVDKSIASPYNTYLYAGLPPGPICVPEKASIDAVLNAENHEYIYFCASEAFNGYHNFAKTYRQHLVNASKYHRELNKRKIYR